MSDNIVRCETPGSGSGPSSGSGIGHDSGLGIDEAGYGVAILEKLREQREVQQFCDVTVRIDGVNFLAHRAVLAACSPYFENLFDSSRIIRQTILVASHPGGHSAFSVVLQFMYTGISSLNDDTVLDVMKFSERFCMTQLRDKCIEFLQQHLSPSNCFWTKEIAVSLGLTGLVRIVDSYIVANAVDIAEAQSSVELSHAHLEELIGRLMPLSEIDRVRLISRWAEHKEDRRKRMPALMATYVQWQKVGPMELCTFLRGCVEEESNCGTALPSDWCLYRVLQSLKDSCLLPDIYFEQLGKLRDSFATDDCTLTTDAHVTSGSVSTNETDSITVEVEDTTEDLDVEEHENVWQSNAENIADSDISHWQIPSTSLHADAEETLQSTVNAEQQLASDLCPVPTESCEVTNSNNQEKVTKRTKQKHVLRQRRKQRRLDTKDLPHSTNSDANVSEAALQDLNQSNNNDRSQENSETQISAKKNVKKRKTSGLRNITCQDCEFKAQTVDKLRKHVRTAHRDRRTFSCRLCSFSTRWNRGYYKHMATHYTGPPYNCDSCTFTSKRIRLLIIHQMDHTDSRPYSCRTCGISFKMKNNLVAHQRCHSGEKPYLCPVCNRGFATKGTMKQHLVIHETLRPYLCDHCGFSTKFQSHLHAHRRTHTGDVFHCSYPDCSYSTPKRSQLACHTRGVHLHVRSYVCSKCSRAFVEKSHLVRHERTHLSVKPFACSRCSYTSTRRDKLKEHCARHHPETDSNDADDPPSRRAKKAARSAKGRTSGNEDIAVSEETAMTGAVMNLVVSVPVLVSGGRNLVDNDGGGTVIGRSGVPTLNGMEVCVLNGADDCAVPSLNAETYKLVVGGTVDCDGGTVVLSRGTYMNSASGCGTESDSAAGITLPLPPPNSCSSLMILGEVADGQLPVNTVK